MLFFSLFLSSVAASTASASPHSLEALSRSLPWLRDIAALAASAPGTAPSPPALGSTDALYCRNNSYFEFLPAAVARLTAAAPSTAWPGDGCFGSQTAALSVNASGVSVWLAGASPTGLCSEYYLMTTSFQAVLLSPSALAANASGAILFSGADEASDVAANGVGLYVLPCGLLGTVTSALATVGLFDGSPQEMATANIDFLVERGVWPDNPPQLFNVSVALDPAAIRSGDYLAILRLDGLDPTIAWGAGGMTGHSALCVWRTEANGSRALYVTESTDSNPLGPTYFPVRTLLRYSRTYFFPHCGLAPFVRSQSLTLPNLRCSLRSPQPPYGSGKTTPWATWVGLAAQAAFHVAVLPLADSYADAFDEAAYWAWQATVQGMPYGYHTMLLSFLDTGGASFANLPLPLDSAEMPVALDVADALLGNSTAGVSIYSMLTWGFNLRTGASCATIRCAAGIVNANKLAGRAPASLTEAFAMPELDSYDYGVNKSLVCSEFCAGGWKAALRHAYPVWDAIQAGEQTPNDNVQMALFSPTQSRFNATSCPGGGLTTSPTGTGAYCQILGTWRMHLPRYNTIPLYDRMNERCPSQWRPASVGPSYVRCADGSLTCC